MMLLREHQVELWKNLDLSLSQENIDAMKRYDYYNKKYENYERKNTFMGWIKHLYLVLLSLTIKPPYK